MAEPQSPASPPSLDQLKAKAPEAAAFLRHLANPSRLILLCHISQGERSVTEMQRDLGFKQPALSQQLADLRRSGLVQTRRESRTIYYSIKDGRAAAVMAMLQEIFCRPALADALEPLHSAELVPAITRLADNATRCTGDSS